jgi:hypothetical protein
MGLIRGFTDEIKMNADLVALGALNNELLNVTLERIGKASLNPALLRASFPAADAVLTIEPSLLEAGDGGGRSVPPIDDVIPSPTVATTINFQTGATSGQTVTVSGSAFALPTGTVGKYRRFALVLRNTGTIDTLFSSEQATIGALPNAGAMLSTLNTTVVGLPLGWVDLECDNVTGKYRTAGSSSAIIENKVSGSYCINRFGAGGGGGASIDAETSARIAADSSLQTELDVTQGSLGSAIDGDDGAWLGFSGTNYLDGKFTFTTSMVELDNIIALETTARANADSTLTANLNVEITARSNSDSTLTTNLNAEITARINGDLAIMPFTSRPFTIDSVAANGTIIINGGSIALNNDGIIATYDGSGTTEADFGDAVSLTFDLDTLLPSATNSTTYYLYVDIYSLPSPVTLTDTGRKLIPVTALNFVLLPQDFETVFQFRYVKIGVVRRAVGVWDTTVAESYPLKKQQYPNLVLSPVVFSIEQPIGNVGSVGQINSGHNLTPASFPSAHYATKISYYGLADLADGNISLNHTLTDNGSVPFTGTGIVGGASSCASFDGTSQYLSSTDSHFNPSSDWIMGGWFNPTTFTPSADQTLFSSWSTGGNQKFGIDLLTTGDIKLYSSTTGSDYALTVVSVDFIAGWTHIALQYVAAAQRLYLYIDSILIGSHSIGGTLYTPTSPVFALGARAGGINYYSGLIDEFFACNSYAFSDDEISKVYSAKIVHSSGVNVKYQDWRATVIFGELSAQITDFITDMDSDAVYVDLSGQSPSSSLYLALYNSSLSGVTNVSVSRMFEGTASQIDALGTFSHNLPSVPTVLSLLVDLGGGYYDYSNASTYFKASATQVAPKGPTLTAAFGAATNVKLLVSVGPAAVFSQTTTWITKLIASSYLVARYDEILADSTSGIFTLTLPAAPLLGDRVRILDPKGIWATNNVTVNRNGNNIGGSASDLTLNVNNGRVELVFDGSSNWLVIA